MNYIKGICRTNLDGYDCSIVKLFATIPNKGDRVEVRYKGNPATLKVVGITHKIDRIWDATNSTPYIEVELHN